MVSIDTDLLNCRWTVTREVKRKFGLNSVWMEPQFLELVTEARRKIAGENNGLGWKEDFLKSEAEAEKSERSAGRAWRRSNKGEN